ncbi:MAG: rhodanese-like domain-containing protein [Candidatus Gracilibacteria bacterium]|jgi:rhodanese-related sulfurtransferase
MKNLKFVFILTLSLFGISACSNASNMQANLFSLENYLKIPSEVNHILVNGNDDLQVLDVRTSEEFGESCISGAKNIDVKSADFLNQISDLDKGGAYLVYCRSGGRSATAVEEMRQAGFNNIIELDGGITRWEEDGYVVENDCE